MHTGPAWVPTFAPKPGPQDEKDSASGAENAQETSPASHVEIKKHLAKKETRAVKASGVKIKKHVAESMRWLPRAEQQSQANNNENTGALKPDNTKSGRDPSGPKSRDGVCSEEPLVSFTPNWNGEQQWAATRQMGQQTNDNEYGSSQRREPFEWFIGPGTTSKPIRTPSKRKSNGRNPQENGCDIRFLAPKKNPTFVFKAADDGQDTRKHLKSSDGGTTRPNPRDDPSGTQVSTDAGDAEMIKTQLDSRRFNRQAATDTETVGTDKMQESRNYSISIPWPVVKPEHSAQGNGNSLSPSINDGSKGDRARAEVESPRREPTLRLNPRNAAWGLSNESQPGPDDAIREPESKSEALKSLAIGEEAPQSQHTSPVANKAKSSTSRAVSLTRDRYPKESSKVEPTRELPAISLLEELFPTEAKRYRREREAVQKPEREVPRLLLSADMADLDDPRGALKRVSRNQAILKNELRLKRLQHLRNFRRREISVLHLLNASKSLTEEDFRRIAPKGKHVEGWMGEGDILKGI